MTTIDSLLISSLILGCRELSQKTLDSISLSSTEIFHGGRLPPSRREPEYCTWSARTERRGYGINEYWRENGRYVGFSVVSMTLLDPPVGTVIPRPEVYSGVFPLKALSSSNARMRMYRHTSLQSRPKCSWVAQLIHPPGLKA